MKNPIRERKGRVTWGCWGPGRGKASREGRGAALTDEIRVMWVSFPTDPKRGRCWS